MSSSSKIKGGGRAIMSQESQHALIDLLMSMGDDVLEKCDNVDDLSSHDKKRLRKKFMKRLTRRHEQGQLQRKFNASPAAAASTSNNTDSNNNNNDDDGDSGNNIAKPPPTQMVSSTSTSLNVRVELVEAIFKNSDKKDKKKSSSSDKKKKSSTNNHTNESSFKAGVKKVMVLPRKTTIPELLKKSKPKLKMKKNPVRVFVQVEEESSSSSTVLFDLDQDLTSIEDGTVLYVSVMPPPSLKQDGSKGKSSDHDDDDDGNDEGENSMIEDMVIDPLESVKRAYQRQEVHTRQPRQLERIDEIIDQDKKSSFEMTRSKLPVSSHRQHVLDAIRDNQVVVLSGATGSGKSTQVPQFLLESSSHQQQHQQQNLTARPYIVVTQPRRVAAISLAHRVADERGCPPPGAPGSSVGYMVRSDRRVDLRSCRIIYMTIGILLRMLVNRKSDNRFSHDGGNDDDDDGTVVPPLSIDTISHLIIDETHERDVNTDFSLTLLKGMMSSTSSTSYPYVPRLILMSATASSQLFCSYFTTKDVSPFSIEVPGKTFPVEIQWLSDCEKYTGETMMTRGGGGSSGKDGQNNAQQLANNGDNGENTNSIQLSPRAVENIDNRFVRSLIVKIVVEQQSKGMLDDTENEDGPYRATGAILVFLPGMGEIESLARCLYEKGTIASDCSLCKIMKLHSSIPKGEQRYVFQPASKGTVKIVLATNIAETSVTIPDISHVIDTCRVKESRYNSSTRIKELVTVWASHASMKQRAGRGGRTSHGICWRLCSEEFATNDLLPHTVPEMARTPLDELILQIGLLYEQRRDEYNSSSECDGKDNRRAFAPGFKPIKFLAMTPTPPAERSLMQACKHLLEVEALNIVEAAGEQLGWLYRLTPLGYHLSRLPMDTKVGKMLIVGCLLGCLDNALTIAAALSCPKSCFLPVFGGQNRQTDPAYIDARDLLIEDGFGGKDWPGGTVKGDLIAVIAAYRAWSSLRTKKKGDRDKFCRSHALNSTSLGEMDTLRRQFFDLMVDAGLVSRLEKNDDSRDSDDSNIASEDALLTSCCLVAGLYPNICSLVRPRRGGPKGGRLLTNDSEATCRPSSSSFQRKRVQQASESGKDAYAVYYAKHRSLGTVSPGQKRTPETFLSEVNFVSKFALLLFGGELELVKNAIIVDKWLKFKVGSDDEHVKQNAVLILSLRELLDKVILEHVVETFSSPEEKLKMVESHKRIIKVVRRVLQD
ncbi:hypothetical protein ACHAXR_007857 [Thalassiosira sp. AJA248-18]